MKRIAGPVVLCLGCILLYGGAACAADTDDPPYLVEYRACREALQAGDIDAAIGHARAAWQSAEQLLGDDRSTATLAFNFGRLQLHRDAAKALPALHRADELRRSGIAELPAAPLRLLLSYAEYSTGPRKRGDLRNFRKALEASTAELPAGNIDLAEIWIALTMEDFAAGRYPDAVRSAASSEAAIRAATPDDTETLAQIILVGGAARIMPVHRTYGQLLAAHREFRRARRLFPPQKDIESFDPLFAQVLAWDAAADAAYRHNRKNGFPDDAARDEPPMPPVFEESGENDDHCGHIEWQSRKPPEYPDEAEKAGYVGAVLVGYNIGDDLKVSDPKILAEVPALKFGYAAASSMSDWRAEPLASDDPACRHNLLTRFTFVIDQ